MEFELNHIKSVEFGVCLETDGSECYRLVPCDCSVQDALKEMLQETMAAVNKDVSQIDDFSPAEKYGTNERLRVPRDSDLAKKHRELFETGNFDTDAHGLDEPGPLISYFAVFRDRHGRKAIGFRRAAQFKGVVKKHLITLVNDALQLVSDKIFKLDNDFDFIVFDEQILIWRPAGFIFTVDMDEHIVACAADNIEQISNYVRCVDFAGLRHFVPRHKLAMRLVAAIKSRKDLNRISLDRMKNACKVNNIEFTTKNGRLMPNDGSEMDFLLLLDRRLYTIELIDHQPETYQAPSRHLAKKLATP